MTEALKMGQGLISLQRQVVKVLLLLARVRIATFQRFMVPKILEGVLLR